MGTYCAYMVNPLTPTAEVAHRAISAEMDRQGITQVELADKAYIPRATLQRRLAGVSGFTVSELDRIAVALGVEVLTLVNGDAA